jgi:23S rRNA pseudouridine1911/1915/1917 synthase
METFSFCVDQDHVSERLDVALVKLIPGCPSRAFVQRLIKDGLVRVNGKPSKSHHILALGDQLEASVQDPSFCEHLEPENIPITVFYEDQDFLIINKPSGMTVHPGAGCSHGTLANALLYHCQELSDLNDKSRPGIVHRLDKETSGLMVVAKNNKTHALLAAQFENRTVQKSYVALVEGDVQFDEGVIDAPLGPDPYHRQKRSVLAFGTKSAQTFYRVLKRLKGASLVLLMPKTGRTHQLRVHMAHLGHPILGDDKYGKRQLFPRLALHAKTLSFAHPRNHLRIEFSSPTPSEFLAYR